MGTRLLSEHLVQQHNPQIRYVRIHTSGTNKATLYAWNEDLVLLEEDAAALAAFAESYLAPYVCYRVKPYSELQEDGVPREFEVPERIVQAAMRRDLDPDGVVDVMNEMLGSGGLAFSRYDFNTGILHFIVHSTTSLTDIEKELMHRYLSELMPLGSRCELAYWSGETRLRSG
ncbi:hypothetical protein [Cohnella terricola]|uniref:Uncharacterized protein n=1 Tax=Cohnella terricola TaxID=1289167 RepID=A0A559JIK1_9BACL|nr:hypothetical protein [Cohnella terricola]TVX99702.1 hypothetical protein FPZ45_12140 [Cohnella terricola]